MGSEQVQVIVETDDQSWFCPERDVNEIVLVGNHGGPNVEGVSDQASGGTVGVDDTSDEFVDVSGENMENPLHELIVVEGTVEANGEAVGDGGVTDVETGVTSTGEDILGGFVWLGFGDLLVNRLGVDEGDGEAIGGKLDGQVNEGDYMALERVWD